MARVSPCATLALLCRVALLVQAGQEVGAAL